MKKYLLFFLLIVLAGCSSKPSPEKIPSSVKSVFNLLVEKPQFIMYLNFGNMRNTQFWKDNISDSVFTADNTLGGIFNTFREATGASLSGGLDELYYTNSWTGENAFVLKGGFDRDKLNLFVKNDSTISKKEYQGGITVYIKKENNLQFFFKDNYTICASNYTEQIEKMLNTADTTKSGLLLNDEVMAAIEKINYKNNLWMLTTEKTFIRGIFLNFIESKNPRLDTTKSLPIDTIDNDNAHKTDSLNKTDKLIVNELFKQVNSVSLSAKMKNDLDLNVQFECVDVKSADFLNKLITGMITLSKFTSPASKNVNPSASEKVMESLKVSSYDSSVQIDILINDNNIDDFRKNSFLKKPN